MIDQAPAELGRAAELWGNELQPRYREYLDALHAMPDTRRDSYALAAALLETALELQAVGRADAAAVAPLLLGDLCLSKASRLLVRGGDISIQVAFARVVEDAAAAAAAQTAAVDVRSRLRDVLARCA